MKSFEQALSASDRVAVVSQPMQTNYSQKYGANTVLLQHAFTAPATPAKVSAENNHDQWILGFCGSISADSAWNALTAALESIDWRLKGKTIVLRVLATAAKLRASGPARIEFLGWQKTNDEVISILSACDATYVPQPFEDNFREMARYSFPNKLGNSLAAGRPIFVHAPENSSLSEFFARYPVGVYCNSLAVEQIVQGLRKLVEQPELCAAAEQQVTEVVKDVINRDIFIQQFASFVGVDRSSLK